jgi:hypothetical protein
VFSPSPLILRSADFQRGGLDDRALRRSAQRGVLTRVAPGAYVATSTWARLTRREQYVARIHARLERLEGPVAASHWSAAAIWGFPVPSSWPREVQITDPRRASSNTTASLHRRPGVLKEADVVGWEGVFVTAAARTAADICLTAPFDEAVIVLDHGLRTELMTSAEVDEYVSRRPTARRRVAAAAAVEFASPLAEWPGESFSRVAMAQRGFAPPILQQPFFDARGKIGHVDFWWPTEGIVGEFDGDWKYTDPRFMRGRTAAEVVRDEKRRQSRLEAHPLVRRVVRWGYAVARNAEELARRLLAAGVPRLNPRGRRPHPS